MINLKQAKNLIKESLTRNEKNFITSKNKEERKYESLIDNLVNAEYSSVRIDEDTIDNSIP